MYTSQYKKEEIIPANSDIPCGCCGRFHRKIKKVDGWWMGATCESQYRLYQMDSNEKSMMWKGYEKQFKKIDSMVKGRK